MQFRIHHLLAIGTGFAAVFALINWSMLAAALASIVVFGPTIAHATAAKTSALVPGLLSAAFWTFAAVPVLFLSDFSALGIDDPRWLISVPIAASLIGGYVGGRIALHE